MVANTCALENSLSSPGERIFYQMQAHPSCSTASVLPRSQGSDELGGPKDLEDIPDACWFPRFLFAIGFFQLDMKIVVKSESWWLER